MIFKQKFKWLGFSFLILISVGTLGYHLLLDVDFVNALYMTVITISTVGYGEVGILTPEAKIFSIFFILFGVALAGYLFSSIIVIITEGGLINYWRNQKMEKYIENLREHYILCGAGETGEIIIDEFLKKGIAFVVIESNHDIYRNLHKNNIPAIYGDASEEEILKLAQIDKAHGLISSISNDAENVYIVLTARQLNKNLYIISRANDKNAPNKLLKAGADKTISAKEIGGRRMATMMLRPSVISFLDVLARQLGDVDLDLEDVWVKSPSDMIGKTLKQLMLPDKVGLIIIAIQKFNDCSISFNPKHSTIIEEGDRLMVLGSESEISRLRSMAFDSGERLNYNFCKE